MPSVVSAGIDSLRVYVLRLGQPAERARGILIGPVSARHSPRSCLCTPPPPAPSCDVRECQPHCCGSGKHLGLHLPYTLSDAAFRRSWHRSICLEGPGPTEGDFF